MKKSLVALATLAATGAVMAQATIYGRTDIGYGVKSFSNSAGATSAKQSGVMDGGNAGSRIGFRGTEDLGGGMKAHFVTEQGISPTNPALFGVRTGTAGIQYDGLAGSTNQFDTGTAGAYTQGTNRQTYLGLEGGFGTIRAGYQYTAAYELGTLSGFTNTSEGVVGGEVAHLWGAGAVGGTRANAIKYISPKLAGAWTIAYEIGSGGGRENTEWLSANTANGLTQDKQVRNALHIDYNSGPLRAGLAYTSYETSQSTRAACSTCLTTAENGSQGTTSVGIINVFNVYGGMSAFNVSTTNAPTTQTANLMQLAGSYNFGVAKVGVTLNSGQRTISSVGGINYGTAATVARSSGAGVYNYGSRAISFLMPMGKMDLVGGMGTATLDGTAPGGATQQIADHATRQLGVKYNFSKRTIAYGFVGSSSDSLAGVVSSALTVKDKSQSIIGIDHQF